ncbi:polyprenyl synthetase family protein [Deferribacterales bacterium RsTz2092]|nr:farnesyl-diphosphate synthase [Deferribacterales bacterium]
MNMGTAMLEDYLKTVSVIVEDWFSKNLTSDDAHADKLYEAMKYSLLAGGKRLRPALLLAGYNIFDKSELNSEHPALFAAAAVEMLHTYSLIHDDLPGMDSDELRRGRPTNHIVYGEWAAILAGDGLLTEAFNVLLTGELPADRLIKVAIVVSSACGARGMVAGQFVDMQSQGVLIGEVSMETLNYIHIRKTAMFISAAIQAGGILAGAENSDIARLKEYGDKLGLAFQIADDILDVTSTTEQLGKPAGSDEKLDKLTYPKMFGLDVSKSIMNDLLISATEQLVDYGARAAILQEVVAFVGGRRV